MLVELGLLVYFRYSLSPLPRLTSRPPSIGARGRPIHARRRPAPFGPFLPWPTTSASVSLPLTRHDVVVKLRDRQAALQRFERAVELPLLILSLVMLPLLIIPLLVELPSGLEVTMVAGGWFIWAACAAVYFVRLSLSDKRWQFVRQQWLDLVGVVLPFLRPLRMVRSLRELRVLRLGRVVWSLERSRSGTSAAAASSEAPSPRSRHWSPRGGRGSVAQRRTPVVRPSSPDARRTCRD